tara:strand:+ start:2957 stop:3808 length:852 start_codon:yes stop_codon:yes gene_type:complete
MARRKTLSPRDEFGNRFVTYTNTPQEAILAQPDLRTTKQASQEQRLDRVASGADFEDTPSLDDFTSGLFDSTSDKYDDANNLMSPMSEGSNAAKFAQSSNRAANVLTAVGAIPGPVGLVASIASAGLRYEGARYTGMRTGQTPVEVLTDQAKSAIGMQTSTDKMRETSLQKAIELEDIAARQAARSQAITLQRDQAIAANRSFINQEPTEAGYRSTGNARGSRSGVSDVNTGEGGRGGLEGPSTRGPSAIGGYAPSLESGYSDPSDGFGIGADPSEGSDNGIP